MAGIDIQIVYTYEGDWVGVYFDGELVDQSHNANIFNILKILARSNRCIGSVEALTAGADWTDMHSLFPLSIDTLISSGALT